MWVTSLHTVAYKYTCIHYTVLSLLPQIDSSSDFTVQEKRNSRGSVLLLLQTTSKETWSIDEKRTYVRKYFTHFCTCY